MKKNLIQFFLPVLIIQKNYTQDRPDNGYWQYPHIVFDNTINYYYGQKVIDPYCSLEDNETLNFIKWMESQNELYDTIIQNISGLVTLKSEISEIKKKQKTWASYPRVSSNRIFYPNGFMDEKDLERMVYIDSLNKSPVEIFNTQSLNKKDSCIYNFNYYEPSFDGKYIALGISSNGSEKANIFIIDVDKKQALPEILEHSMAGNIQWLPNDSGFFYIQDKELKTEEDKKTPFEDSKVRLHILGTNPKKDKEIFSRLLNKNIAIKKDDGNCIFTFSSSDLVLMNVSSGLYSSIYYSNLAGIQNKPAESIVWNKICDADEKITGNVLLGNKFFGMSFNQNPNGQLILKNLPDTNSTVIYDAHNSSLDDMVLTSNALFLTTIENGLNKLIKVNPENLSIENIELPFLGGLFLRPSFGIVSFYQPSANLWFSSTGYNHQWGEYTCDNNNKVLRTDIFPEVLYMDPPLELKVEEIEVRSHDGAMVPLSIIYKKGIKFDGTNPANIEAYGAFGVSNKPAFNRNQLVWFKHGGVYAFAHVRGGGEKGDAWYKGGLKATKSNSWKDLIACSEFLIKNNYTNPQKLAVSGYSAGGIAVGRAITERPDLFKTAVIYVGVLNTVRFENSFNNVCTSEFGTIKDSLEFQYLYDMDTYLHIKQGIKYPSILFTASMNDSRVAVWQPAKAVAKFQEVCTGDNLILFRIEDKGHFDYPADEDIYSFLFWQLGDPDFKLKLNSNYYQSTEK